MAKSNFSITISSRKLVVSLVSLLLFSINPLFAAEENWAAPRTEYGFPDLQGIWHFGSTIPLQRPVELGTQSVYTEAEALNIESEMVQRNQERERALDPNRSPPEAGASIGLEADYNFSTFRSNLPKVNGEYRTSIIIDPPDGRLPVREEFVDFRTRRLVLGKSNTDGPENQPVSGRCIIFGAAVPSLGSITFNSNMQIVQNKDYVVLMTEMIHDARIIRLNDVHHDNGTQYWMGDSVGHWEEDTLVVHTKNFRPEQSGGIRLSEAFDLVERLTLVGDNEILYAYTVTDENAYTRPFTAERVITRRPVGDQIYEFACHEGNYSMPNILTGARRQETDSN